MPAECVHLLTKSSFKGQYWTLDCLIAELKGVHHYLSTCMSCVCKIVYASKTNGIFFWGGGGGKGGGRGDESAVTVKRCITEDKRYKL